MRNIILASQSPRRREILRQVGIQFDVKPSDVEEVITKTAPAEVVEELSYQKAVDVYNKIYKNLRWTSKWNIIYDKLTGIKYLVIGADTVVAVDGMILGKPKSEEDAFDMLKLLQGRTHEVYTGVTFAWNDNKKIDDKDFFNYKIALTTKTFSECTKVTFCHMTDSEIRNYIATKEPMDKAGAYGIQGQCAMYISKIEGDYNNVVGLPIARVYHEMKDILKI